MQHYVKYEATKAEIQALETVLEAIGEQNDSTAN
jgi:hypothetical protein